MQIIVTAAIAALMTSAANATVTVYTSQAAFNTAAGATTTETFSGALDPALSFVSTVGNVSGGQFNDRTVYGSADTTFTIAGGTTAFGAVFDEGPGGFGQGLLFTLDGTTTAGTLHGAGAGTFFGFISTVAFTTVHITSDFSSCCAETYNLDNLQFKAAVPEPASWALMIGGFGLVGTALRRRATLVAA